MLHWNFVDYLKHRESVYAGWLYQLPELAESLKNDYEHKKDLNEKFQEMKEVMKIVQDNNLELEVRQLPYNYIFEKN